MTRQQEGDEAAVKVCDHQRTKQIGVWSDAMYRCNPVLECLDCATEIYQGMPQPKLPATVQPEDETTLPTLSESAIAHMQGEDHNYGTAYRDRERQLSAALRDLKTVLDRESATTARFDAKITDLEAERDALKAERDRLIYVFMGIRRSVGLPEHEETDIQACMVVPAEFAHYISTLKAQLDAVVIERDFYRRQADAAVGQETPQDIWERGVIHGLTLAVDDIEDEFDPKMQEQTVAIRENISDLRFKKYTYTPPLKAGQ